MRAKIFLLLRSPYFLALLVGLYPITFFLSINWFMFDFPRLVMSAVGFTLVIFVPLAGVFALLSRVLFAGRRQIANQLFVFISIALVTYLMRFPLLALVSTVVAVLFGAGLAALLAHLCREAEGIHRLNQTLLLLSFVSIVQAGVSIAQNGSVAPPAPKKVVEAERTSPVFVHKPNVYYFIADGYPSAEALSRILKLDSTISGALEDRSFTVYPSALSNYMTTLSSMLATFSMEHHYYEGRVGNLEIMNSRVAVAGKANPVVDVFRDNGYRVGFIHQTEYLLTQGCFVDECMPQLVFPQLAALLIPDSYKKLRKRVTGQSLEAFEQRALDAVERGAEQTGPRFTYFHMHRPSHSATKKQHPKGLARYREKLPGRLEVADSIILNVVDAITASDPGAVIIVSSDHGTWSLGSYGWADDSIFEGAEPSLTALDHLGILLAIRWPDGPATSGPALRTSVNLFRHVFAYLAQDDAMLAILAPDSSYLMRGRGQGSPVYQVGESGRLMPSFVELSDGD